MSKRKNTPDKYWKDELQRLLNILANQDPEEDIKSPQKERLPNEEE